MDETRQICTFHVDEHFFGVPVERVQEIITSPQITNVPLAHNAINGVINLRGQLLVAMDLRRRLGLKARKQERRSKVNVVLRTGDSAVAVRVDSIDDVLELERGLLDPPPETLPELLRSQLTGVYRLEGRLLLFLDVEAAVDVMSAT